MVFPIPNKAPAVAAIPTDFPTALAIFFAPVVFLV